MRWQSVELHLDHRFGRTLPRTRLYMITVLTVYALAFLPTGETSVETFTVLLLTLTFFAVATLTSRTAFRGLAPNQLMGFQQRLTMLLAVRTSLTVAVLTAELTRWEALAVHLETLSLLASAAALLSLYGSCRVDALRCCLVHLELKGQFDVFRVFEGRESLEVVVGTHWAVFLGFNQQEGLS